MLSAFYFKIDELDLDCMPKFKEVANLVCFFCG